MYIFRLKCGRLESFSKWKRSSKVPNCTNISILYLQYLLSTSDFIWHLTTEDRLSDWQLVLLDVILKKSLEKLLGSDVQCFCQPDELWQKKRTNRETGRTLLEDNPVWYAEDQKSWFAHFYIALKRPWNDTTDCKQQTDRDLGWWMDVTAEVNVLNADEALHEPTSVGNI